MWNVVEFEIEKHAVPLLDESPNQRGPFGRKQCAANLDSAHFALQAGGKLDGVHRIIDVESD
jgi:hypothetical protein